MTVSDLQKQIKKRNLLPVYFFHGEEDFIMQRAVEQVVEIALQGSERDFNYHVYSGSEHKGTDIVSTANEFPFMAEKRVVLVKEAHKLITDNVLVRYVNKPSQETILILTHDATLKPSRRKKTDGMDLYSTLQSTSNPFKLDVTLEFKPLKEYALVPWLKEEFQRYGKTVSDSACATLIALKGTSTRVLAGEVEKLHIALPDRDVIDDADLHPFLGASREMNVFELVNKIFEKNLKDAIRIAEYCLEASGAVLIISTLSKQMFSLWQIAHRPTTTSPTDEDARKVGLAFGWQYRNLNAYLPSHRDPMYFEHSFHALLEADIAAKSQPTQRHASIITQLLQRLIHPTAEDISWIRN